MSVPQYDISLTVALLVGFPLPSGKRFGKANVGKMEVSKSLKVPLEYPINLLMSNIKNLVTLIIFSVLQEMGHN